MALEPGVSVVKGGQLIHGKIAAEGEHRIEADGAVPFGQDEAIPIGIVRLVWIDAQVLEVERDQHVHGGQGSANVPGPAGSDSVKDPPSGLLDDAAQLRVGEELSVRVHGKPLSTK